MIRLSKSLLIPLLAASLCAQPDNTTGRKIFEAQCALCHGQNGTGGRGPGLNRPRLSHAPDDDSLKKAIVNGIGTEMPGAWQLHETEVTAVAAYVRALGAVPPEVLPGDAARGAKLYQAKGCGGCHMVAGKGEGFGPELSEIGARRNGAYLKQVLQLPASLLPDGFLYLEAVPVSGEPLRGVRVNEDSFTLQIKDAGGRFHSLMKTKLREVRRLRGQTPMPSYQDALSAAELDDLVAFLASLKGKA